MYERYDVHLNFVSVILKDRSTARQRTTNLLLREVGD
jgi:hypothetical protein